MRRKGGIECTIGRSVDEFENGFFEGVWAGSFLDFSSALGSETYGSGIYRSKGRTTFIQRKDVREFTFILRDRLNQVEYISNSLCFALSAARIGPDSALMGLLSDNLVDSTFEEGKKGFHAMNPVVAQTTEYTLYRICYSNFWFDDDGLLRFDPPVAVRDFKDWNDYKGYLLATTQAVFSNGGNRQRKLPLVPLSSVSRGYDSPAVTAIANQCGCQEAVTLRVNGDNGRAIARMLGMRPLVFPHVLKQRSKGLTRTIEGYISKLSHEFVATAGIGDDINSISFESVLNGKIFLSGVGGDGNWQKDAKPNLGLKKSIPQSTSLTEFRLRVGFAHYPPILAGSLCTSSLIRIANSDEMSGYSVNQAYDRPIARRFAEEAGIPRSSFGIKKSAQNPFFTNRNEIWREAVTEVMKRYTI
ncbi:hypothetical protein SAMN04488005_3242 [Yoonia tamlensis]|uniref:Uncharacterized protein n=1 Tax=Yoonia tamlensis TaxID=390270 RepID=A0A1I6I2A9_9RHOB|nr:hypothetical protein SAMN04488005_3242 [Yoonia tamlensis]